MKPAIVYAIAGLLAAAGFAIGYVRERRSAQVELSKLSISATGEKVRGNEQDKSESDAVLLSGKPMAKSEVRQPLKPPASLKEILDYPSALHRLGALKKWFDSLPTAQFEGILSGLLEDPTSENQDAVGILFLSWAERAPEEGVKFLKKVPGGFGRNTTELFYYKAWGRKNREGALEWARANLSGMALFRALKANEDAPNTLEGIQAISDTSMRYFALREYIAKKAADNRMLALDEVIKMTNSQERQMAAQMVMAQWGRSDPVSAMLWIKGLKSDAFTPEVKSRMEFIVFDNLILKDMVAARRFVGEMPAGGMRVDRMDKIASKLVSDDLQSALTYFEEIKTQDPNAMPGGFFNEWLRVDPLNASKRLKDEITKVYSADKLQNEAWRISNILNSWTEKDPAAAAKFAVTLPEALQPTILQNISRSWIREGGKEAADWVETLPEGNVRNAAMERLGAAWSEHDTTRSHAWLNALPQGSGRWSATRGIASSTIDDDPDAALGLVRSISNETERINVLASVWRDWSQKNKPSAEDWLKNTNLSEVERAAIIPKAP